LTNSEETNIVNLGHGILPNIPVDHAKAFIDAVKNTINNILFWSFFDLVGMF
jgi:uroporphyrinogen-III decarboxylase